MSGIVMLKLDDCKCETCLRCSPESEQCRANSPVVDPYEFFPPVSASLWCCQGLWRDANGRIWSWEDVARGENTKGEF
jgi:hypothetical protein